MKSHLKLIRIHHSMKNILIFFPIIFSGNLINMSLLVRNAFGFLAFSLVSSVVYIFNDIHDVESDRRHPTKRNRPIASGAVSVKSARYLAAFLLVVSIFAVFFTRSLLSSLFIVIYLFINVLYSKCFKNIPILDISILVLGFLLRVIYGSAISGIEISNWLYLTVMSLSFYMGFGKRRNELNRSKDDSRRVLKFYNRDFLDKNMYMCLTLTIMFYSLWCVDSVTIQRISSGNLVWTVPFVILICMKYSLIIEGNSDGDPVEVILADKILLGLCLIYAAVTYALIYIF